MIRVGSILRRLSQEDWEFKTSLDFVLKILFAKGLQVNTGCRLSDLVLLDFSRTTSN